MDYELEVFDVYDEDDQSTKRQQRHTGTRKKSKQKLKYDKSVLNPESREQELSRSRSGGQYERIPRGDWRKSILNFFGKLVIWRTQRRYQTTVPDKVESPHCSRDYRRGYYVPCGEFFFIGR